MAYDPQVVQAARERLEKRRRDAVATAAALRERLCEQIPRLREIEQQKAAAIPQITHAIPSRISSALRRAISLSAAMVGLLY